jgi:hypothetical protein
MAKVTGELFRFSASTSGVGEAVANVAKAASALVRALMDTFAEVRKVSLRMQLLAIPFFVSNLDF